MIEFTRIPKEICEENGIIGVVSKWLPPFSGLIIIADNGLPDTIEGWSLDFVSSVLFLPQIRGLYNCMSCFHAMCGTNFTRSVHGVSGSDVWGEGVENYIITKDQPCLCWLPCMPSNMWGMINCEREAKGWCITTLDTSITKNENCEDNMANDGFIKCPDGPWNPIGNCGVEKIAKNFPFIPHDSMSRFHCYMQVHTLSWLAKYSKCDSLGSLESFHHLVNELESYHEGLHEAQLVIMIVMSLCSSYVIYLFYRSVENADCNINKAWWVNLGLFIFGIIMSCVCFVPGIKFDKFKEKFPETSTLILAYIDFYETTISDNILSAYLLKGEIEKFARELMTYNIQPNSENTISSGLLVMFICWSGTMFVIMDLILGGWHSVGSLTFIFIISIIRVIATHWRLWMKDNSGFIFKFNIDFACCIKDKGIRDNFIKMIMDDWKIKRGWKHGMRFSDCRCLGVDQEIQVTNVDRNKVDILQCHFKCTESISGVHPLWLTYLDDRGELKCKKCIHNNGNLCGYEDYEENRCRDGYSKERKRLKKENSICIIILYIMIFLRRFMSLLGRSFITVLRIGKKRKVEESNA
ncbi:15471_t:CDS:1 [Acaulospora morrowiae]|uniref:15471_t:CDS:1 n=1 Tax=Acaulospora morrowiae TaxID=94023 RepID=A0A9N9ARG1_9GLOM|nr:15471_t:CDS:1 [Acaulospora morrowiae]